MAGLMKGSAVGAALVFGLAAPVATRSLPAFAQGATDYPIPSTAREAYGPIGEGFASPINPRDDLLSPKAYVDCRKERLEARRRERWPNAPAFFRDTSLEVNSRTYWFGEDQFGFDEPKALTTGGSITYKSGELADLFQLHSVLYTTQPLYENDAAPDTENVSPDGDSITTFGQIHGRIKYAGQEVTAGRHLIRTPYINPYDVRMIPLTFEGVTLLPEGEAERSFNYIASYLSRYKPRNTDKFISFSEGLGVEEDEAVLIAGVRKRTKNWNYGVSNYWIKDTLNTAYAEIDYILPFGGGEGEPSFRVGINHLDQRTVGADLIAGAPYNTYQASARVVASYRGFVLTGAVSETGEIVLI